MCRPSRFPTSRHPDARQAAAAAGSSSGAAAAAEAAAAAPPPQRPIEVSRALAAARVRESARADSLFLDPFAVLLAEGLKVPDDASLS